MIFIKIITILFINPIQLIPLRIFHNLGNLIEFTNLFLDFIGLKGVNSYKDKVDGNILLLIQDIRQHFLHFVEIYDIFLFHFIDNAVFLSNCL